VYERDYPSLFEKCDFCSLVAMLNVSVSVSSALHESSSVLTKLNLLACELVMVNVYDGMFNLPHAAVHQSVDSFGSLREPLQNVEIMECRNKNFCFSD
jgi:hypothetical protein